MNPVQTYVGRLVAEPELRFTPGGDAVLSMRIAVSDNRKSEQGQWENSNQLFFDASVWREQAEALSPLLSKGQKVLVQGKLYTRSWEDKEGQRHSRLEMRCFDVWLQPHAQQAQQYSQQRPQRQGSGWAVQDQRGGFGGDREEPPF
ncbi:MULTISPECIES: single-stranded DNA-binding protein [Corynebacterium]|uniref:single-stranded DNA-binding protein n=1 Tax=Corynebacterium TaxID=1716 RepID=UPI00178C23A3|nr:MULTISPECIES: single-stranded DNA-binding protein [Corynebacterium]